MELVAGLSHFRFGVSQIISRRMSTNGGAQSRQPALGEFHPPAFGRYLVR